MKSNQWRLAMYTWGVNLSFNVEVTKYLSREYRVPTWSVDFPWFHQVVAHSLHWQKWQNQLTESKDSELKVWQCTLPQAITTSSWSDLRTWLGFAVLLDPRRLSMSCIKIDEDTVTGTTYYCSLTPVSHPKNPWHIYHWSSDSVSQLQPLPLWLYHPHFSVTRQALRI